MVIEGVNFDHLTTDHLTTDHAALFKLYKSGDMTAGALGSETLAQVAESGSRVRFGQIDAIVSLGFNHTSSRPTSNLHLRKAIALNVGRDEIMNKVMGSE